MTAAQHIAALELENQALRLQLIDVQQKLIAAQATVLKLLTASMPQDVGHA